MVRRDGRSFLVFSILTASLAFGASGCFSLSKGKTTSFPLKDSTFGLTRHLPDVLKYNYSGFDFEAPESQSKILEQAREYVSYHRKSLSLTRRLGLLKECALESELNPFCTVIAERQNIEGRRMPRSARQRGDRGARLLKHFAKTDFDAIEKLLERDIINALKSVNSFAVVESYARPLITNPSCGLATATSVFGLKVEKFFPEETARVLAKQLYEHAVRCPASPATVRASYRLGLLNVWANQWEQAEKAFANYIDHPDAVDLRSRLLYWRMRSAERMGNSGLAKLMREKLTQEYPLTLHGLLVSDDEVGFKSISLNGREPAISFRSAHAYDLNRAIAAAESLQELKEFDLAFDALEPFVDRLSSVEPSVRLYLAVLLMRSGETIKKFQIITGLYREDRSFVTKSTLEMLYPLRRFELVRKFQEKVDPLLVLSLIRQESAFNVNAQSRAGAVGLMQVMPGTARLIGRVSRKSLFDPEVNVHCGVNFFSKLLERYSYDAELALAAYNAGPERVDEWVRRYPLDDRLLFLDLVPFRETRDYVASISRNYYWYLKLYTNHAKSSSASPMMASAQRGPGVRMPSSEALMDGAKNQTPDVAEEL